MRAHFVAGLVLSRLVFSQQAEVKLDLRCPAPCSFRQGESIWLSLDFTATTPNEFRVLTNYTDREMAREQFSVTPQEGWSDPIEPYLRAIQPGAGSFHFHYTTLVKTPATVRLNLNQFVRFDQPGTYGVSVTSRRASRLDGGPVEARSNQVNVEILPAGPQWQTEKLAQILRDLDQSASQANEPPDEIRDLCNLDTLDAELEIARGVGEEKRFFFLYEYGLIRSPYRAEGVREMERLLNDPDFPVTELFLWALENATRLDQSLTHDAIRKQLQSALANKLGGAKTASEAALQQFR